MQVMPLLFPLLSNHQCTKVHPFQQDKPGLKCETFKLVQNASEARCIVDMQLLDEFVPCFVLLQLREHFKMAFHILMSDLETLQWMFM